METKSLSTNYGYATRQDMQYELFPDLPRRTYDNELCREYSVEVRRVNPNDFNSDLVKISSPSDVYNLLSESRYLDREVFYCLHLNTKNRLLSLEEVSKGTLNASIVHPREIYKAAILQSAAGIILSHNHPSGDPEPSREDFDLTTRIKDAGDILGIDVLDHVIIGNERYCSLRERGAI